MSSRFRKNDPEAEVQAYLDEVSAGRAGQNPQAQALARSSSNPRAQRIGDKLMRNREADNMQQVEADQREAEQTANEAAKAQEQATKDAAKAIEDQRKRDVRAHAAQGGKVETDIETGKRSIATHPDGSPVSEAGPVGKSFIRPTAEAALSSVPGMGAVAQLFRPADQQTLDQTTEVAQTYQNDRFESFTQTVEPKIDPKTGEISNEIKDEFGAPQKVVLGTDSATVAKNQKAAAIDQKRQEIALQKNALAQQRAQFEPRWQPVKAEFLKAKSELEGLPSPLIRKGAIWMRVDERTGRQTMASPEEVAFQQKLRDQAQIRYDKAKKEFDPLAAQDEILTKAEREVEEARLLNVEDKIRFDSGIEEKPDAPKATAAPSAPNGQSTPEVAEPGVNPLTRKLAEMDIEAERIQRDLSVGAITQEQADTKTKLMAEMKGQTVAEAKAQAAAELEVTGREIASQFIGTGVRSQELTDENPGNYAGIKNEINEMGAAIFGGENTPEKAAQIFRLSGRNLDRAIGMATGKTKASLTAMRDAFDKAGIAPEDRKRIIQDAAKTQAWTAKDDDTIRSLSTGDIVINPGKVFGQKEALITEINSSNATPEAKAAAVKRLDSMREKMAGKLFRATVAADSGFESFANKQLAKGNKDKAAILDQWSASQKDRGWVFKAGDAITEGIKTGSVGVAKTVVGGIAGTGALLGADGVARSVGKLASDMGGVIESEKEAAKLRGMTGKYGIASDLTDTVAQMAPMIAGGTLATGMKGISAAVTRGMSVYGWAGAQGYESKLADAVSMAEEQKGSKLTAKEIGDVLGRRDTQVAAFLNGAQTAILAAAMPKGTERIALGKMATGSMTVTDFLRKGGMRAVKDGTLRSEIKAMGKTIFADAKDEALEEFSNQVLDGLISVGALGDEMQLGTLLEESFKAGALGSVVGGAMPQIYRGQTKADQHKAMLSALQQQSLGTPDSKMVSTAMRTIDPQAKAPDETEIKAARQLVGPDMTALDTIDKLRIDHEAAMKAKDYAGAAKIDAEIQAAFTEEQKRSATDTADAVLLTRELTALEEQAASETWQATQDLNAARASGDKQAIAAAEVALEQVKESTPNVPLARAAVKIATGRNIATLTDAELRAVGYKPAQDGTIEPMSPKELADAGMTKPLIRTGPDGAPVILDEAITKVAETSALAATRIKLGEQEAIEAAQARADAAKQSPTTKTDGKNAQGQSGKQAAAKAPQPPPTNQNAPGGTVRDGEKQADPADGTGSTEEAAPQVSGKAAEMDATIYTAAREANPDLPTIQEVVAAARAAGEPVSASMEQAANEEQAAPQATAKPAKPPQADAASIAEKIKARVEAALPALKGRIKIVDSVGRKSGGAIASSDGTITLVLSDIADQLKAYDAQAVEDSVAGVVTDHEVTHIVQYQAVRSAWEDAGGKGSFNDFWNEWYGKIAGELSPELVEAAADLYNGKSPKPWGKMTEDERKASQFGSLPVTSQAAEVVRMLVEASRPGADKGRFSELMRALSLKQSPTLIETLRRAVEMLVDMIKTGKLPESVREHVDAISALYNELLAAAPAIPEISDDIADSLRVARQALDAAFEANPEIKANDDLRIQLDDSATDLAEIMAGMPQEQRRAFVDNAIADWIESNAEAVKQAAEAATEQGKPDTARQKAKAAREAYQARIRAKAREILNSGDFSVLSSIFEKGTITPKPNVIALILKRRKEGKKLTEREIDILSPHQERGHWDGMPRKQDYPGGGNNAVIRAILDLIMAPQGQGQMPHEMGDNLDKGVTDASSMWMAVDKAFRAISKGTTLVGEDPDSIETPENIAKAEAERQEMPPTVEEIASGTADEFGPDSAIAQKAAIFAGNLSRFDEQGEAIIRDSLLAEAGRIRAGVPSAEAWQAQTTGWSDMLKQVHRAISTHTPKSLQAWVETLPIIEDDWQPMFSSAVSTPPFYSQLARTIEAKMPKIAAPAQVMQIAVSGAKAEEVKWSGLATWLQGRDKISKAEVLEWLANEGAVRFEEVTSKTSRDESAIHRDLKAEGYAAHGWNTDDWNLERLSDGEPVEPRYVPRRVQDLLDELSRHNRDNPNNPKFAQYTLPGGENYREIVLAMPNTKLTKKQFLEANGITEERWNAMDATEKFYWDGRHYTEHTTAGYTSSHFPDVPNYVAHMRVNERTDAEGKPGLFVEEFQSDRHQAGREKGYSSDEMSARLDGDEYVVTTQSGERRLNAANFYTPQQAIDFIKRQAIAPAPYEKTWPLALFKRALRDAVASGKEWIGWTVGETQNDRFDLSKQLDEIGYNEGAAGGRIVGFKNGAVVIEHTGVTPDKLQDYIGKDAAEKLMAQPVASKLDTRKLSGVDLKVGGSGMKGFYDNILPKEIGKYVKQWQGKVELSKIGKPKDGTGKLTRDEVSEVRAAAKELLKGNTSVEEFNDDWGTTLTIDDVPNDDPYRRSEHVSMILEAVKAKRRDSAGGMFPAWKIDITPAMKAGVEAGQALFSSAPDQGGFDFTDKLVGTAKEPGFNFDSLTPGPQAKFQGNAQKAFDAAKNDKAKENVAARVAASEGLKDPKPFVKAAIGGQASFDFGMTASFDTKKQMGFDFTGKPVEKIDPADAFDAELRKERREERLAIIARPIAQQPPKIWMDEEAAKRGIGPDELTYEERRNYRAMWDNARKAALAKNQPVYAILADGPPKKGWEQRGDLWYPQDTAKHAKPPTIDAPANEAATSPANDTPEPTEAQKKAGNYKVGRVTISGMEISIENPAGSVRSGTDKDGEKWEVEMKSHYGYIRQTTGKDGDHIDIFIQQGTPTDYSGPVFVVNQNNEDGAFDEHKVVMGPSITTEDQAKAEYLSNYSPGWNGAGTIARFESVDAFREWATEKRRIAPATGDKASPTQTTPQAAAPQSPEIDVFTGTRAEVDARNPGVTLAIARGDKGKRYTLWQKVGRRQWDYIRTLPTDKTEAIDTAAMVARRIASGEGAKVAFSGSKTYIPSEKEVSQGVAVSTDELTKADLEEAVPATEIGTQTVGFGKYANELVSELASIDPDYAMWLAGNASSARGNQIKAYLERDPAFLAYRDADVAARQADADRIAAAEAKMEAKKNAPKVEKPAETAATDKQQPETPAKPATKKLVRRQAADQYVSLIDPIKGLKQSVSPELRKHMFPMQESGADAAIASMEANGAFLNGDGAGVGKTRQILAVASHYATLGHPVVIITENAAIGKPWEGKGTPAVGGSMAKDSEAMGVEIELMPDDGIAENGRIRVTTYHRVTPDQIRPANPFRKGVIVIFDESQNLANIYGDISKETGNWKEKFGQIFATAEKTAYYSATPADKPHQLAYLYRVLGFETPENYITTALMNGMITRVRQFGRQEQKSYDVPGSQAGRMKLYRWVNALMKTAGKDGRFIKREISYEGTDIQFQDVIGKDITKNEWASHYDDAMSTMGDFMGRGAQILAPRSYELYAAELTKIGKAVELAKRELAAGRKVVLYFSRIREMEMRARYWITLANGERVPGDPFKIGTIPSPVELLKAELQKEGIVFAELHGKSGDTSKTAQAKFSKDVDVLLASVESGGTGINLDDTVGNNPRTEIFMFAPYRGISTIQAMGRIWRASTIQNDNNPNRFAFIVASDIGADAARSAVLGKKIQLMNATLGGTAVQKLPMSKVSFDKEQLVGLEIPEEGETSNVETGPLSTAPLKPVNIQWKLAKSGATWWARATADLLEWVADDGPERTGLGVKVVKKPDGYLAFADSDYQPEEFAQDGGGENLFSSAPLGGQGFFDFGTTSSFDTKKQLGFLFGQEEVKKAEVEQEKPTVDLVEPADVSPEPGTPEFKLLPQEAKKEIVKAKTEEKAAEKTGITDFGEKIGGARKDLSTKSGESPRPRKTTDKPGWFNRYEVNEVVAESNPSTALERYWMQSASQLRTESEVGRFVINDKRKTDWKGNPERATRQTFATREEAEAFIPMLEVSRNHRVRGEKIEGAGPTSEQIAARVEVDAEEINAIRNSEAGQLMSKLDLSNRFRASLAKGEIDQARFEKLTQDGYILTPEEEAQATAAKERIDKIRNFEWPTGSYRYAIWRKVTDRKMVQVVKQTFETEKEAMEFMAKNAADIIETKTSWREELIVKPEKAARKGPDRRQGPATPEMFQNAFGFRGVEFGNWMRQAGDGKERQEVLNHAYDGLLDLAELLRIPPKAISLNGELGLAFGARGQGLSGAKAHYEPDYVVINLTKMSGAGSLAHEWIHALDHYLGRQDGRASSQLVKNKDGDMVLKPGAFENNAVSSGFSRQSNVREEVRNAFVRLMDTIMTKAVEYVEDSNNAERFVAASRKALEDHLATMRKDYTREPDARWEKRRKVANPAQLALFDSIADRLINGQDLATEWRTIEGGKSRYGTMRWTNDVLEQLGVLHKEITNRAGFDKERNGTLDNLRGYMTRYAERIKMLESAAASETKVKKVPTDFSMNAKRIDQGSASDYWNVPHEMLARGFSAYVEDRISATGGTSDFLSYGSDNRLAKYRMLNMKPFPEGTEREAINQRFDQLFDVIETKETEKGVQLFSSPAPEQPDLFAAATAPDATQKLGQVKVGKMNALAAYRTLTAKRDAGKALTGQEEQQLLDAETALGQKLAFDMDGLKGNAPEMDLAKKSQNVPVFGSNRRDTQDEMSRAGEIDRSGQISLLSSPVAWPPNLYAYTYEKETSRGETKHVVKTFNERSGLPESRVFDSYAEAKVEMDKLDDLASPAGDFTFSLGSSSTMPEPPPSYAFERAATRYEKAQGTKKRSENRDLFEKIWKEEEAIDAAYEKELSAWLDTIPLNKPITFQSKDADGQPNYKVVTKNSTTPENPWRTTTWITLKRPDWTEEEEIEYEDLFKKTRWYSNSPQFNQWWERLNELGSRPVPEGSTRLVAYGHEEFKTRLEALQAAKSWSRNDNPQPLIGSLFSSAPESARHAELEAKFNAGTITLEETAEAEKIVEARAKAAGYEKVFHGTNADFKQPKAGREGRFGKGLYTSTDENRALAYGPNVKPLFASGEVLKYGHIRFSSDLKNFKSAKPFTGVPLDQRFNPESPSILYSSAPDPVQAALSKMPPVYGEVFRAVQAGATPEEVMQLFPSVRSPKAVTNILNQVRARVVVAQKAAAGTLNPETDADGLFVNGRPDLAEGANPDFVAVDQIRNDSDIPDAVSMNENYAEADKRLAADYEGEFARLEAMAQTGKRPDAVDIAIAKQIFRREALSGGLADPQRRMRVALFRVSYREQGTEQARAFQMRRDENLSPAERNALHLTELLYEPSPETQERMKSADKETRDAILKQWMDRIDAFKAEMKAEGLDIEASLEAWHAHKQAVEKAEQVHDGTKAAMDEAMMKLSRMEKTVVRLIRDGAKLSTIMRQTGMTKEQIQDVHTRFAAAWRKAIQDAGRRFAENSLASSTPDDIYGRVMSDLGWQSWEDIDDTAPDYIEVQAEKRKEAKKKERTKKKIPTAPKMDKLTPQQQAEIDAAFERFQAAPMSTWTAWWQETARKLTPMIGQTSFEQFRESVMQPWRDLWQTEMEAITDPAGRMTFEQWLDRPAATWTASRTNLFDAFRQPINETKGTFDVNNPMVMSQLANEWARRNGSWINKLTEFYKMSILSGPQTMLINASGGLFVGYEITAKRAMEAAWNGLMGMFGAGDVRSATFSEFLPMMKNIRAAMTLAARNAVESWKLQSPVFESYASGKPIQLDFTGIGPEYAPPATTSAISRFLRNITFRELTAVDEFWKGMFAQLDVAALSHRIAAKEEKLSGKAYADRVEQLMKPGSLAWQRTISRARRATFQDQLAYGKWTKEDEKANPAHKEGMPMTWQQALKKSETQSAWTLLDAIAVKAMEARKTPFFGPILHMFALPFIATPKNMIQRGLEVTPLGLVVDLIDGMRSLRRRVYAGDITKEESNRIASELYNNTRFIQTLTNQSIGVMLYLAVEALTGGDDDDEQGRPWITGTLPFSATKKGERDTAQAVMPPQSIRIGQTIIPYGRIEPFATALSAMVDLAESRRRNDGFNAQVITDAVVGLKEQFKDKLFLKGIGDILRVVENPERGADRLAAGWMTGFVPNIVRQPVREMDSKMRNTNPKADDGFFEAVAKRVGYSIAPQTAPAKLDVWGDPVPSNRGELLAGSKLADSVFRIFDPLNVRFGGNVKPIDAWMFHYNHSQPDSSLRLGIEAPSDEVTINVPGETKPRKIALTAAEHAQAIQNIGTAALEILGEDWDWRTASGPDATQKAELIKDTFTKLKRQETERLKAEKLAEIK